MAEHIACWLYQQRNDYGGSSNIFWTRTNFLPLTEFAPFRRFTQPNPTSSAPTARNIASTMNLARARPIRSAAIPIGEGRSGFRSITLLLRHFSVTTTFTVMISRWNALPVRVSCKTWVRWQTSFRNGSFACFCLTAQVNDLATEMMTSMLQTRFGKI